MTGKSKAFILALSLLVLLLAGIEALVRFGIINEFFFPSPSKVFVRLLDDLLQGGLIVDIAATTAVAAAGMIFGTLLGTFWGLLGVTRPTIAILNVIVIAAIGAIPILAIAPLMVFWFGTGWLGKVIVAAFGPLVVSAAFAVDGLREVDERLDDMLTLAGVGWMFRLVYVVIPSVAGRVAAAARFNAAFSMIGAFTAEFISAEIGVGRYILRGSALYDSRQVFAGLVVIAVVALGFTQLVDQVARWLAPWQFKR